MDQTDHFLRVLGQSGFLILAALIGLNGASLFAAIAMGQQAEAVLLLRGVGAAVLAVFLVWIMAQAALMQASRTIYAALFWLQILAAVLAAGIFWVATLGLIQAGGAA